MESPEKSDEENWNLYVLRYNSTGNYYVGIQNRGWPERMLDHWRGTTGPQVPDWSYMNKSGEGFTCYWYKVKKVKSSHYGVGKALADRCENQLAKMLADKISTIAPEKAMRPLVANNRFINGCNNVTINSVRVEPGNILYDRTSFDSAIDKYLRSVDKQELRITGLEYHCKLKCRAIFEIGEFIDTGFQQKWYEKATCLYFYDDCQSGAAGEIDSTRC